VPVAGPSCPQPSGGCCSWTVYSPGPPAYNADYAYQIDGFLDVPLPTRALIGVVERHEVLRTTFQDFDGEPGIVVHDRADVQVPVTDWTVRSRLRTQGRRPVRTSVATPSGDVGVDNNIDTG
jgi:hypothetical protein